MAGFRSDAGADGSLFNHKMSLPIRQGKMFPDSPPPSKKFGRSLGTIKVGAAILSR
jgi:hypothetical protein